MLDRRLLAFLTSDDPDATLIEHLASAAAGTPAANSARWRPGEPLRLLLLGFVGAGDVGAEMRTGEIVRQIRHLLGADVGFDAITVTPDVGRGMPPGVQAVPLKGYAPDAIRAAVDATHGVIACEGSLFKSSFSNVLSAISAAGLGMAAKDGKLAVAYGGEVGVVEPKLAGMIRATASEALVLPRNSPSLEAARALELRAAPGADPSWTLRAAEPASANARLSVLGWNGRAPVLIVCPANPFWWPVTADPERAAEMRTTGAHADVHFADLFFRADSVSRRAAYRAYLEGLGQAIAAMGMFTVYVAMEREDAAACRDLATFVPAPIVSGAELGSAETVALLRAANLVVSSRMQALAGAMPGLKPAIGVAADERIRSLLDPDRILAADSRRLAEELILLSGRLDSEAIAGTSRRAVVEALEGLGRMGEAFVEEVRRVLPDYTLPSVASGWRGHLPPLGPEIEALLP